VISPSLLTLYTLELDVAFHSRPPLATGRNDSLLWT
jgi:hypothetical protein